MVDTLSNTEELENSQEASEEAQAELDYETEFETLWGHGKDTVQDELEPDASDEPTGEDEPSGEDLDEEVTESEEQGSSEEDTQANSAEPPQPDPDDPYSWINSLPEEVRQQADALKHRALSDQGRVAAYNRRLSDLQAELDRMKSRGASATAAKDSNEPSSAAPELPEKYKQLKEDFPEFADAVEAIREYDRQIIQAELDQKLRPLEEERTSAKRSAFREAVSDAANEIFNTQETGVHWQEVVQGDDFKAWLEDQPGSVQAAARTPDPKEAIYVLRQYERDYRAAVAELEAAEAAKPVHQEAPIPKEADKVKSRRTQRQKTSVTPGSKPIISDPNNEGGDYHAEFDRVWG